jgi:opacity protein-like surface antigen
MVAHLLRETTIENQGQVSAWTTLGKASTSVSGFGGFFGYNWQWEDVIIGVEANYTNSRATLDSTDSLTRMFSTTDGYSNNVTVTANAAVTMKDYLTIRGRFGYAFDRFLPYGMLGVAVGRADSVRAVTVVASGIYVGPPPIQPNYGPIALSQSENRDNIITYGFSVGAGIDVAVVRNVFVRAEWEYLQFPNVNETRVNINTGRVAVGVKF